MKFIRNDDDLETSSTGKLDLNLLEETDLDQIEVENDVNSDDINNDASIV